MSQVYASEPPTSGRVILETTHGPLEIQLWCRECPHTTRFFLQLCLDGFYDDILFHRILPNTLLQCGAIRHQQTTNNHTAAVDLDNSRAEWETYRQATQAPAALERRQYELHSRLRFSHRGVVAMALPACDDGTLSDDDLIQQQAQFFVTLEDAAYLDGKHVVFGTVAGPTIFNALRMGRIEVDETTAQPMDLQEAPRIKNIKIVENPIHTQLVPQRTLPWRSSEGDAVKSKKKKKKRKGKLDTNVLSFGDELEEEGITTGSLARPVKKSKPSETEESSSKNNNDDRDGQKKKKPKPQSSRQEDSEDDEPSAPTKFGSEMTPHTNNNNNHHEKPESKTSDTDATPPPDADAEPRRRNKKLSAIEARRAKYASNKRGNKKNRQEATMERLMAFQGRVKETVVASKTGGAQNGEAADNSLAARMARRAAQDGTSNDNEVESYHGQVLEGKDEDKLDYQDSSDWMATTFKCRRHIDHSAGADGRKADDYEVVDDRKESDEEGERRKGHHRHHHQHHRKQSKRSKHSSRG